VVVNRVVRLSCTGFAEEVAAHVEPPPGSRYDRGLHTISGVGSVTLIDGKRFRFNRHHFTRQLRKKLKY
jgi:hypothetical protein